MADLKISQLTGATTPLGGTEEVPLVQSGSTKKVTVANLTAGRAVAMRDANLTGGAAAINIGATADNTYHYVRTIDNDGQAVYFGNDNAAGSFFGAGAYGRVLYSEGAKPVKVFVNGAYRAEYDTSGNYKLDTGNLVQGTAAKGINFTANTPAAGMTSQLLNWYEEGTWTPEYAFSGGGTAPSTNKVGFYTRVGRLVVANFYIYTDSLSSPSGNATISGLPFTSANLSVNLSAGALFEVRRFATDMPNLRIGVTQNSAVITIYKQATNASAQTPLNATDFNATAAQNLLCGTVTYIAA